MVNKIRLSSIAAIIAFSVFTPSLVVFAGDTPTVQTEKEKKDAEKKKKKEEEQRIIDENPHSLIVNSISSQQIGLTTHFAQRSWLQSQQDPSNVSKFKSNMSFEIDARQIMVFDPKRNALRNADHQIYGLLDVDASSLNGGGANTSKDIKWNTSTTQNRIRLSGGAQLGSQLSQPVSQGGFYVGGSLIIDSDVGKKKDPNSKNKLTEHNDLVVDSQAELGMSLLQNKNNFVQLLVPVGFRFQNEQDADFAAKKLMGPKVGFNMRSETSINTQKGRTVWVQADFAEEQSWLKNATGQSVNAYTGEMKVRASWSLKKSTIKPFVGVIVSGLNEKDYDSQSASPQTPVRSISTAGAQVSAGITF